MDQEKLEKNIDGLAVSVVKLTENMEDLTEIVTFIKDNAATKKDLADLRDELKGEIAGVRDELKGDITGIRGEITGIKGEIIEIKGELVTVNSHLDRMEASLAFISKEIEDIKNRLDSLEKRTKEDDDAIIKDIIDLRSRVVFLENEVHKLQAAS